MSEVLKEGLSEKKTIPTGLPTELKRHGANQVPKKAKEKAKKAVKVLPSNRAFNKN